MLLGVLGCSLVQGSAASFPWGQAHSDSGLPLPREVKGARFVAGGNSQNHPSPERHHGKSDGDLPSRWGCYNRFMRHE